MSTLCKKCEPIICVTLLVMGLTLWGGCGIKAPPKAPRQPSMVAVSDLSARYQDGTVVLTWHHLPANAAVTGYMIYQSPHRANASDCQGCPLLFEKATSVFLDPAASTTHHKLTWSQTVNVGVGRTYKVIPVQSSGSQGPDSNLVQVNPLN